MYRDLEREILPMALQQGMAIAAYNVLNGGRIRTDEEEERRRQSGEDGTYRRGGSSLGLLMRKV